MENNFLVDAVIYLAAAVVCVPVAKRLGLGSVLGYLMAGILIGPFVLGFVGQEGKDIMHFAEFGVVMMLFIVGLELEPATLWKMRTSVLGYGSLQMVGTTLCIFALMLFLEWEWPSALAVGMAFSMSSTAIVLQSLKEKNQLNLPSGTNSFSILLFQDIAVIPILAMLPLLAKDGIVDDDTHHTFLSAFPAWLQTFGVLLAVGSIIIAGRYLIVPMLRFISHTHLRELFTATALLIVIAIALLMQMVGLSPALGTFLAGVVLASSEYKHELESDLDPFKGLLLGLFFLAVGASINFNLILARPVLILLSTLIVMAIKMGVLYIVGNRLKLAKDQHWLFTFVLSQVGEFAFVLLAFMAQVRLVNSGQNDFLMAVVALSMLFTPLVLLVHERIMIPRWANRMNEEQESDVENNQHKVILIGFSHFGSTIGRFLRANNIESTILDNDSDRVLLLRKMGFKVYYGDATRIDILHAAGAETADIIVVGTGTPETNIDIVKLVLKHYPQARIMVRARNRMDAYEFMDLGILHIYRETLDAAIRVGVDVLGLMGERKYSAYRTGQKFLKYDNQSMKKLKAHRHDMNVYVNKAKEEITRQEEMLADDKDKLKGLSSDVAWDSEYMRDMILQPRTK